jgi:hypothetical protein
MTRFEGKDTSIGRALRSDPVKGLKMLREQRKKKKAQKKLEEECPIPGGIDRRHVSKGASLAVHPDRAPSFRQHSQGGIREDI